MKIVHVETLISNGAFPKSTEWKRIRRGLHQSVAAVDWPPGSGTFTIFPQSRKKPGEGNAVKPIKRDCIARLEKLGWIECALDAIFYSKAGPVVLEWKTGDISMNHQALNQMAMGLMKGHLIGASLVVPSHSLCEWLTDRICDYTDLIPYFDLWRSATCRNGVLEVIVVEQDAESFFVPRIPKRTGGKSSG